MLSALTASPYVDNTDIALMGDHGMHLGDHQLFGKWTVYEQSTHIPLIIAGAGVPKRLCNSVCGTRKSPALWSFLTCIRRWLCLASVTV